MSGLTESMKALLVTRRYAILATTNDDGSIHMTPVWFLFEGERLFVECHSTSRKAKNIVARPNVSLIVDVRKAASEKWVSAAGIEEIVRGQASQDINEKVRKKYLTAAALDHPKLGPAFAAMDDMTIRITPKKWRSFDIDSVDRQFFGGMLSATPEQWL